MKQSIKQRILLMAQVGILVAQVLGIGIAISHADEPVGMTISAERPATVDAETAIRDEIQASARIVVWQARFDAKNDLEMKLDSEESSNVRIAGTYTEDRG